MQAVRSAKIADVLGSDFKDGVGGSGGGQPRGPRPRRSASKDHVRGESMDTTSVAYEKQPGGSGGYGNDEVSIGMEWAGDGVSIEYRLSHTRHSSCPLVSSLCTSRATVSHTAVMSHIVRMRGIAAGGQ